jgi:hypothetical protein
MDEVQLSAAIFESFKKCIALREKYCSVGLQRKQDNPRDYPNMTAAALPRCEEHVLPPPLPVRAL